MQYAPGEPSRQRAVLSWRITLSQVSAELMTTTKRKIANIFTVVINLQIIKCELIILLLMESKSNKIDLIYNLNTDIWNQEALMYEPKEESNLYLGTKEAIGPIIFEKNIGAILTVMDNKSYVKEQIKQKMNQFGLIQQHMFIESQDSKEAELKGFYQPSFDFIDKHLREGTNVLVHCKGGMSRSPAIVCSYLMKKHNLPFDKCYQLVKNRRKVVDVNEGFQKQLKTFEKQLNK